ncbi:pleurocidin-like peptide WF3 [Siniperca chuatsi]|uniref:pleurocidin-like peptide WF3 n=1 Tax=Siniperca chuatsi TaxID=119488 RepID=UPI001CE0D7ED|nr:pleurocidin-like peptide WF3 [Siniperca chuatsi]
MKCIVVFLVLSMVVLMAEPGEGFFGALIHGAIHGIHSLIKGKQNVAEQQEQQEQLDKRSVDYNPGQPSFA